MSDAYVDPDAFVSPSPDPVNFVLRQQQATAARALTSLDADPEEASRAQTLADATGAHPAVVYGDLENFEGQHKAALTSQLLNNNKFLRQYVDSHPLADKISNDDYGQLDALSQAITKYAPGQGYEHSILKVGIEGFGEGFGEGGPGSWIPVKDKVKYPVAAIGWTALGFVPEAVIRFGSGVITAAGRLAEAAAVKAGADPEEAKKQADYAIHAAGDPALWVSLGPVGELVGVPFMVAAHNALLREAAKVKPYAEAGKVPPVGVSELVDASHIEQAKIDAEGLSEALKEATKSATRERSPDLFANFIRQHTDAEIGISADAVRALYGEKPPVPGEGPLGFVPDLADQLARAETTGGDIRVSTAEYLAKVEPEVHKQVEDHIRARPEGMTVEEGKNLPPIEEPKVNLVEKAEGPGSVGEYVDHYLAGLGRENKNYIQYAANNASAIEKEFSARLAQGPIDTVRQSAGLQGIQERKATIHRIDSAVENGDPVHIFSITDSAGKDIADLSVAEELQGTRLFVNNIEGKEGRAANDIGPRAMQDILQQLKEEFPNAKTLLGYRVSGAREKANKQNVKAEIDLTKIKPRKKPEQLELDVTRLEDKEAFEKASAIGMTVDQYKRYQKLIEKQHAEDVAYYTKRAEVEVKQKLSQEWKDAQAELRPAAVEAVNARPDVAADLYLSDGTLYGERTKGFKIGEDYLTLEQKAALPKTYYAKDGIHPDDLANLTGFDSGTTMIQAVSNLAAQRKASGMNEMNFRRRLISVELERQVQERLGKREAELLEEAKEHVLSETQFQLLHEQTMRLAEEAGAQYSITKEDLTKGVNSILDRTLAESKAITSDAYLADAGRAGRAVEMALLKGDAAEAFRQSQRQTNSIAFANEAMKLEKERTKFDKLAKKYAPRKVERREQSAVNYIQDMLSKAGVQLKLSSDEIAAAIQHEGYASFTDYVADKQQMGWEPAVADWLQQGAKPLDKMTVAEFRDLNEAVQSLDFIGRKERQIEVFGEKLDWEQFRSEVIGNLQQLPARSREGQGRWIYKVDAELTRMEELIKDFDLRQELGPLYSAVIEPMMKSKAMAFDLLTDLGKHFKETKGAFGRKWRRSLSETIPQDFMIDSYTQSPLDMSRENLINVMLNWGNRSNIEKLTRGYASLELGKLATKEEAAAFEVKLKHLIDTHARKEDWDFVQRMWQPFKGWKPLIDTLSRNTSGSAPKWIEVEPVQTPHGAIEGGYWPVKYDRLGSDLNVIEDKKPNADGLFGSNYIRATTAKGHLKERTGYVDFVDLHNSIEQAASVMQQTIQDIAFRDALIQASKVFYDKPIRSAIRKHYGAEYEAQLIPWLKRIANQYSANEQAIQGLNGWLRRVRINLVGHALPLNLKVILSPDIGVPDPKAWASFEANRSANAKFAMEHSNEIRHLVYNMDRDFREQLERAIKNHTWDSIQAKAVEWGFVPVMKVSQEFRMSTFVDQFNKAKAEGRTDHEASVIADSYVRERHGAASIVDLPSVMESNEAMKQITMFYGYFNTMYNWQRQLPGNVRRREVKNFMVNGLGSVVVGAAFGALLFNQAKENDSWWKIIGKALLLQPLSTIPVVRDATSYFMEGFPQRSPTGSLISAAGAIVTDVKRAAKGQPLKQPIRTGANVIGLSTGLPLAQIGRTGQFMYDVQKGKQRPRNILEYIRGIIHGEARLKP